MSTIILRKLWPLLAHNFSIFAESNNSQLLLQVTAAEMERKEVLRTGAKEKMEITVSVFTAAAGMILSAMTGFWTGRSLRWKMENISMEEDGEETAGEAMEEKTARAFTEGSERKKSKKEQLVHGGLPICSPCSGKVSFLWEGGRKGAVILPEQGAVYAPASGKITRLYPMGNAFVLSAESGVELFIKIGGSDELLSMYYRPRIVQNEIVTKGKLLLEFDLEGLRRQGEESSVSVSVEAPESSRDVFITEKKEVRTGEELFWVEKRQQPD